MTAKGARDAALGELADEPPPTFVARRKALASELKAGGDAAGAKAVLARRRPTWTSWALGRLARTEAATLHQVIAAHAELAAAVKAGAKIASAQTAFSRALETAGRLARGAMIAAGHAGAAGEARKVRAALRQIGEQGERALAAAAAGNLAEPEEDAANAEGDAEADEGGFLVAAKTSLAAKRPTAAHPAAGAKKAGAAAAAALAEKEKAAAHAAARAKAAAETRARAREQARLRKERRALEAKLARAEKTSARESRRVEALETELTDAIAARKAADAQLKELRSRLKS